MKHPVIHGKRVYLRGLKLSDADGPYLSWMNDPEITRFLDCGLSYSKIDDLKNYIEGSKTSSDELIFAIIDKKTDKHIGNLKIGKINMLHRNSVIGIVLGGKEFLGKSYEK